MMEYNNILKNNSSDQSCIRLYYQQFIFVKISTDKKINKTSRYHEIVVLPPLITTS